MLPKLREPSTAVVATTTANWAYFPIKDQFHKRSPIDSDHLRLKSLSSTTLAPSSRLGAGVDGSGGGGFLQRIANSTMETHQQSQSTATSSMFAKTQSS